MLTNSHTGTRIDEVATGIYRINTPLRIDAIPGGFNLSGAEMGSSQSLVVLAQSNNTNAILQGNFTNKGSITLSCLPPGGPPPPVTGCNGGDGGGAGFNVNDKDFVNGFGSNGGEVFLSYLNIGEAMVIHGDAKFSEWDSKMTENLVRVQNDDGSWSGHHCITGKTFCTSAALMVLMVDRTTTPVMDAVKKR